MNERLKEIETRIHNSPNPYAGVGELAMEVVRQIERGADRNGLISYFNGIVSATALEATPQNHIDYARRLLAARVSIFEEVYKLFSLLQELEAMRSLGLIPPGSQETDLRSEFAEWRANSKDHIRNTAKMFCTPWSKDHWYIRMIGIE